MSHPISLRTQVELGVVPTHIKFVGGLAPDADGRLPRDSHGRLLVLAEMESLMQASPVRIRNAQVTIFPGVNEGDSDELFIGLRNLGLGVHPIMMVGGADPMNPEDEEKVATMLAAGIEVAKKHGFTEIASTSVEEWMQPGATPKTGAAFQDAVAQNVRTHLRAMKMAGVDGSSIQHWHIEFLRKGEFQTFNDIRKCWEFVKAANAALGRKFFQIMVDAAHSGDSELSIAENIQAISEVAAADELGTFHASAKTTRGCLTTDDGWIGALLAAAARTGKLKYVFVEIFHHQDPALEALRQLDPGHGIDTRDGRSYSETVVDGLTDVAHRLNNLVARGYLKN